jgi:hypothetical protein
MKIFPFGEGSTDKIVFELLMEYLNENEHLNEEEFDEFYPVDGIYKFAKEIKDTVEGDVKSNADDICILVFCDLDKGREHQDILNQFKDIMRGLLPGWNGNPIKHTEYNNIYLFKQIPSEEMRGLRIVLHLANISGLGLPEKIEASNNTTDGYVLALGLEDGVLGRFASKDVRTTSDVLHGLITECLPNCFSAANIEFEQDKDFLAAYFCVTRFWVKHRTEQKRNLTEIIFERSKKYDKDKLKTIFSSWIEAIKKAGEPIQ